MTFDSMRNIKHISLIKGLFQGNLVLAYEGFGWIPNCYTQLRF